MSDERKSTVLHMSQCPLGVEFNGLRMGELAYFHKHPEHPMMQLVEITCPGLPNGTATRTPCPKQDRFMCKRFFESVTVCDDCRQTYEDAEGIARIRKHWEHICPKAFRLTDRKHPGFPITQWDLLSVEPKWRGETSLFFYGPTGKGKTRLAMEMLQRAMKNGRHVGILWPEKLRSLVQGYDSTTFDHYAAFDVLLMDDPLLTACRESKLVDAIKLLIDVRMRDQKATIFTSQIGTEEEISEGKEFGEAKGADIERIKAILRRLKESCQIVPFAPSVPVEGQESF